MNSEVTIEIEEIRAAIRVYPLVYFPDMKKEVGTLYAKSMPK